MLGKLLKRAKCTTNSHAYVHYTSTALETAPAYLTRRADRVFYPTTEMYNNAYNIIGMNSLPSKTKETAFQILNRTTWTNNKAYKSGTRDTPDCDYCGQVETIEHLIHNCEDYSAALWEELGHSLTSALTAHSGNEIPTIQLTSLEIIYNKIHPSLKLHLQEKSVQLILVHLVQEIKRDIIYRRMNTNAKFVPTSCPASEKQSHCLNTKERKTFKTASTF